MNIRKELFMSKYFKFLFLLLVFVLNSKVSADFPRKPISTFESSYSQFWLLYQKEKRDDETEIILRPFFSNYSEGKSNYNFRTVLFPLYYKESTSHWSSSTLFFIFIKNTFNHPDSGYESDYIAPFFFWGFGNNEKDKYAGFFPFYGKMKSKLSFNEIKYVLFPIYSSWKYQDYKAFSVLWPLTLFGKSSKRDDFRILPFYSKKYFDNKYLRYSILWPFFQWGFTNLDKKEPISYFMFFPFYAQKKSQYGNMTSRAFIWLPFLGSFIGYGKDERTDTVNFNLFFFLFQYGKNSKDYKKIIFFPFYGKSTYASKTFTFITPFYSKMTTDKYSLKSVSYYLFPFFQYSHKQYLQSGKTDTYYKIWPFFRMHKDREGNLEWNFLSLFPTRSQTIERVWSPFWSLIEYHKFANGEKRLHLFFRLYTQRWTQDELYISIPLLFELAWSKYYKKIQIFYGLFGYERVRDIGRVQLFWFIKI